MEILIRFLLAILWGSLVGAEREYRSKAAGFRTIIMISIGACFFANMSAAIGGPNNPDRIAANIVTGIGFLGAGVIFKADNRINGVTTAATIWAVAAVGLGIGTGYYFASACGSLLILFVLAVLPSVETTIDKFNQSRELIVHFSVRQDQTAACEALLTELSLKYRPVKTIKDDQLLRVSWLVQGSDQTFRTLLAQLKTMEAIHYFEL
ncbi:MgtC/SapB family protein [Spirosoma terrae]|uniref:MgtC/SapB family protein n=1 Tax=Spirosoma terrae TaxID=1968276 RepID=A0A6L9L932_9BACT|nr:MgtC/SapB family protein [Spirosoma terrae]